MSKTNIGPLKDRIVASKSSYLMLIPYTFFYILFIIIPIIETTRVSDGTKSSKISRSTGGTDDEVYASVSATGGNTYYIEAYIKTQISSQGYADFVITGYDNGGNIVGSSTQTFSGTNGWKKATVVYQAPSNVVSFRARFIAKGTWSTENIMWFDNINVNQIT